LELTRLGVTAAHLVGVADALREILIAGHEFGVAEPDTDAAPSARALSPPERNFVRQLLKRTDRNRAAEDQEKSGARLKAWSALERARRGESDALILFWFPDTSGAVEWQVRFGSQLVAGPSSTNLPRARRAYLALEWAMVAKDL
jgi:hypothetical protein